MRQFLVVSMLVAGTAACAGRASHTTPMSTLATTYSCGARQIEHQGDRVTAGTDAQLSIGFRDDEGHHYVAWPTAMTTVEAVEYVIPSDARADAIERVYDTSRGKSRVDWRLVKQRACIANGGYNDALARFANGQSFDQVAKDLDLDKQEARKLVRHALVSLQKRYYKDR
jgi:hypothetical protein